MELTCCRLQIALPAGASTQGRHWQRRASLALAGAELAPRGLPPQAILVVRRLADPAPGVLLQGAPWQAGRQWGAAARTQLEACWRQAARPIHGPVPPAAPAVWFADQAEWLACLSLDLARGVAHARWWWVAWRSRLDSLGALWQAEARWLPAALALLAGADSLPRSAGPVPTPDVSTSDLPGLLAHLDPAAPPAIAAALAAAFTLPPLTLDPIESERLRPLIPQGVAARAGLSRHEANLTPVQRLLAAALALAAQPAAVAQALRRPHFFAPAPVSQPVHAARPQELAPSPASFNPPPIATTGETSSGEPPASRPPAPSVQTSAEPPRRSQRARVAVLHRAAPYRHRCAALTHSQTNQQTGTPAALRPAAPAPVQPPPAQAPILHPLPEPWDETGLATELGGLWFLVNLLVELELLAGEGPPSPWRLAVLVAALLTQDEPLSPVLHRDPVWAALDSLAGGEGGANKRPDEAAPDGDAAWAEAAISLVQAWLAAWRIPLAHLRALLAQPARLYLTRTHVDVVFGLEQIDLDARRAGLDRNPGWVAEFGRVFTFHFL